MPTGVPSPTAQSSRTTAPADATVPVRHPDAPAPGEAIGSHYDRCFGCGSAHRTGLHLAAVAGEGVSLTATFAVTADHQGAPGLAHGGLLTAALDETLGMLLVLLRVPAVTGRLETDFLAPVPVGTTLHLAARCTGVAGRKIYVDAEGRTASVDGAPGPVAVRASALFVAVGAEHFSTHGWPDAPGSRLVGVTDPPRYAP